MNSVKKESNNLEKNIVLEKIHPKDIIKNVINLDNARCNFNFFFYKIFIKKIKLSILNTNDIDTQSKIEYDEYNTDDPVTEKLKKLDPVNTF